MYGLIDVAVIIVVFFFATWLPNFRLLWGVLGSSGVPFLDKLGLPLNLIGGIATNFTLFSASYTIAIAVLFGMNIAMIIYFLRRKIADARQAGISTGFLGIASGVLGIGCAACGSFILMNILTFIGASWVLSYLPLAGAEFGILGVSLLAISIYLTSRQIQNPTVCKI